mmetsp:Transcript_35041/g.100918  ORF Transcript_35041/g.100918 Transcript_35041/m.100918 type:complete len:260 (-) Transcript_35041:438-1217(-)
MGGRRMLRCAIEGDAGEVWGAPDLLQCATPSPSRSVPQAADCPGTALVLRVHVLVVRAADVVMLAAPILLFRIPTLAPLQHVLRAITRCHVGATPEVCAATVLLLHPPPTPIPDREICGAIEVVHTVMVRHRGKRVELRLVRATVVVLRAAILLLVWRPARRPCGDVRPAIEVMARGIGVSWATIVPFGATPSLLVRRPTRLVRGHLVLAIVMGSLRKRFRRGGVRGGLSSLRTAGPGPPHRLRSRKRSYIGGGRSRGW